MPKIECRNIGSGVSGDAELFHFGLQGRPFHAEASRGAVRTSDHSIGLLEGAQNVCALNGLQGRRLLESGRGLRFQFPKRNPQVGPLGQNDGTLYQVF